MFQNDMWKHILNDDIKKKLTIVQTKAIQYACVSLHMSIYRMSEC